MFSSFTGASKFGRRRKLALPSAVLALHLDATGGYTGVVWQDLTANGNESQVAVLTLI
jgi:hypothetical protein